MRIKKNYVSTFYIKEKIWPSVKIAIVLKCSGGSTSGLHSHLRTQHDINLLKRNDAADKVFSSTSSTSPFNKKIGLITNYFNMTIEESFSAVISRMVARDTLSFSKICYSYDIRKLLVDKEYTVPKSPNSIKEIVMKYGNKMQNEVCQDIAELLKNYERFSLTFNEWASIKNRRYLNNNVHVEKTFWNLGLSRIHSSMPANKYIELLENKLNDFGINFSNIVGITTDGAAIMKKVGSDLNTIHQLCFAHGIQLAVIQIIYKQNVNFSELEQSTSSNDESNNENSDDADTDLDIKYERLGDIDVSYKELHVLIINFREVVKIFRISPTKNEILQRNIVLEFGKDNELQLILDTKTRWNSLLDMLERFYQLRSCIRKSLIDINYNLDFSEAELNTINEIIKALQPIKLTIESLSSSDFTLLNADIVLKFMLDELLSQNTSLSKELHSELIYRIKQRTTNYSDVLQYLHHPIEYRKMEENDRNGIFNKISKVQITKLIVALIERITKKNSDEQFSSDLDQNKLLDDAAIEQQKPISMEERLHKAINQKKV